MRAERGRRGLEDALVCRYLEEASTSTRVVGGVWGALPAAAAGTKGEFTRLLTAARTGSCLKCDSPRHFATQCGRSCALEKAREERDEVLKERDEARKGRKEARKERDAREEERDEARKERDAALLRAKELEAQLEAVKSAELDVLHRQLQHTTHFLGRLLPAPAAPREGNPRALLLHPPSRSARNSTHRGPQNGCRAEQEATHAASESPPVHNQLPVPPCVPGPGAGPGLGRQDHDRAQPARPQAGPDLPEEEQARRPCAALGGQQKTRDP